MMPMHVMKASLRAMDVVGGLAQAERLAALSGALIGEYMKVANPAPTTVEDAEHLAHSLSDAVVDRAWAVLAHWKRLHEGDADDDS